MQRDIPPEPEQKVWQDKGLGLRPQKFTLHDHALSAAAVAFFVDLPSVFVALYHVRHAIKKERIEPGVRKRLKRGRAAINGK